MRSGKMRVGKKIAKTMANSPGFTIVELIIVIFLLTIILAVGLTFYAFGIISFNVSESQADLQQNARFLNTFITRELRIAEKVIIIDQYDGDPGTLDVSDLGLNLENPDGTFYIYIIYIKESRVYYQKVDGVDNPTSLLEGISQKVDFNLDLKVSEEKSNILQVNLFLSDDSGRTFDLNTEVLVLNVNSIDDASTGSGSAIVYQVPAPYPRIQHIAIEPQFHAYDGTVGGGGQIIDVEVITIEVSDDKEVTATLWKKDLDEVLDDEEIVNIMITPVVPGGMDPTMEDNRSKFKIELPAYPNELFFGDYYIHIDIDSVYFSQHRIYYILPVIHSIEVTPLPGKVREGTVKILTSGVPVNTPVVKEEIFDPTGKNVYIGLVKTADVQESTEYKFYDFEIIKPSDPKVKADGSIEFNIKIDPEDAAKNLFVTAKIGRLNWWEGEKLLSANAYLKELNITSGTLAPSFVGDTLTYNFTVDPDQTDITVTAALDDDRSDKVIYKNGDLIVGTSSPVNIPLEGLETVAIAVTAEDGITTRNYEINILQ